MFRKLVCAALSVAALTGCGTLPTSVTNPGGAAPLELSNEDCALIVAKIGATSLNCDTIGEAIMADYISTVTLAVATSSMDDGEERRLAGGLLYSLLAQSDQKCDEHMTHVASAWNGTSSALGVLGALASAAGTVTTGGNTSQILSAVSTGAGNSRTTLSKLVFGEQAYPIIRRAISTKRETLRNALVTYGQEPSVRTVGEALSEATRYHTACGTSVGISLIEKAVTGAANGDKPTPPGDESDKPTEPGKPTPPADGNAPAGTG